MTYAKNQVDRISITKESDVIYLIVYSKNYIYRSFISSLCKLLIIAHNFFIQHYYIETCSSLAFHMVLCNPDPLVGLLIYLTREPIHRKYMFSK